MSPVDISSRVDLIDHNDMQDEFLDPSLCIEYRNGLEKKTGIYESEILQNWHWRKTSNWCNNACCNMYELGNISNE